MDLLEPLPRTPSGHEHLLFLTDHFSKMTRSIKMKRTTAVAVAKAFFGPRSIFLRCILLCLDRERTPVSSKII